MTKTFEFDWFSHNIPSFERHLGHLRGEPCRFLEIGTHEGRSATWLLENILTHPRARIDCIDIHLHENLLPNLKAAGGSQRVSLFRKKASVHCRQSAVALRQFPLGAFDFIFVDGNHWTLNVLEDAVLSFRLAKRGSIIAFDDYSWDDPAHNQEGTPKPAIDVFLDVYNRKIEVLEKDYTVWVRKRSD